MCLEAGMKKSLSAALVILFTFIGATAIAAIVDVNVQRNAVESVEKGGSSNGTGVRNMISKD